MFSNENYNSTTQDSMANYFKIINVPSTDFSTVHIKNIKFPQDFIGSVQAYLLNATRQALESYESDTNNEHVGTPNFSVSAKKFNSQLYTYPCQASKIFCTSYAFAKVMSKCVFHTTKISDNYVFGSLEVASPLQSFADVARENICAPRLTAENADCILDGYAVTTDFIQRPITYLPEVARVKSDGKDIKIGIKQIKLYRWHKQETVWKERAIGNLKLLYNFKHSCYHLILRSFGTKKLIINHRLSHVVGIVFLRDNTIIWGALNFAESANGNIEILCARFNTVALAKNFQQKIMASMHRKGTRYIRYIQAME